LGGRYAEGKVRRQESWAVEKKVRELGVGGEIGKKR